MFVDAFGPELFVSNVRFVAPSRVHDPGECEHKQDVKANLLQPLPRVELALILFHLKQHIFSHPLLIHPLPSQRRAILFAELLDFLLGPKPGGNTSLFLFEPVGDNDA